MSDCIEHTTHGSRARKPGSRPFIGHRPAYIVLWERVHGPVPEGYVLHHTCEHPWCVNVEHLACITQAEHIAIHKPRRNYPPPRTHCAKGHEMTPENTLIRPDGSRRCKRCHADAEYRRRHP